MLSATFAEDEGAHPEPDGLCSIWMQAEQNALQQLHPHCKEWVK